MPYGAPERLARERRVQMGYNIPTHPSCGTCVHLDKTKQPQLYRVYRSFCLLGGFTVQIRAVCNRWEDGKPTNGS